MTLPEPIFDSEIGLNEHHNRIGHHLPRICILVVSGALAVSGTSSAEQIRYWDAPYVRPFEYTASGYPNLISQNSDELPSPDTTGHAVAEIRRLGGLTWDQLGTLFGVSRRSVHFWASGKSLNATHEARVMQVLDIIRRADRGDSRATRTALLQSVNGVTPFDLLAAGSFQEARSLLGETPKRASAGRLELNETASSGRKPLLPEEMASALSDRIHRDLGKGRPVGTMRKRPSGR